MSPTSAASEIVHASCVTVGERAILIRGPSGTGKSALALELMAYGAELVADDRTVVSTRLGQLVAEAPDAIRGLIEARGVGILHAEAVKSATVVLVVDLESEESERLPPVRNTILMGHSVPLLWRVDGAHFSAAIMQLLKSGGRYESE